MFALYNFDKLREKWTGRSTVQVNEENERFAVFFFHVVVETLNLEISRCHLAHFVKELY